MPRIASRPSQRWEEDRGRTDIPLDLMAVDLDKVFLALGVIGHVCVAAKMQCFSNAWLCRWLPRDGGFSDFE